MIRTAFALAAALLSSALAAAPSSLTVWIPEQGQTATLSAAGLVGAAGNHIVLNKAAYELPVERPLATGFARLYSPSGAKPTRLEVVQGGKVTATRDLPKAKYVNELWGTGRGPCLSSADGSGDSVLVRCFVPDLKSEWTTFPAKMSGVFFSASGEVAYTVDTDWKLQKPYSEKVFITRHDLTIGEQTPLSYQIPLNEKDAGYHQGVATAMDARDTLRFVAELPGERYLICAGMTMPKFGCRLDVVDRDLKRLFSLQGDAWVYLPQATRDGSKVFYMGNTLQVWDAQTGQRLSSIHDPLWDKQKQVPLNVYLTPGGLQAAVVTSATAANGNPDLNKLTAYLYRLSDGKFLNTFAVKP